MGLSTERGSAEDTSGSASGVKRLYRRDSGSDSALLAIPQKRGWKSRVDSAVCCCPALSIKERAVVVSLRHLSCYISWYEAVSLGAFHLRKTSCGYVVLSN